MLKLQENQHFPRFCKNVNDIADECAGARHGRNYFQVGGCGHLGFIGSGILIKIQLNRGIYSTSSWQTGKTKFIKPSWLSRPSDTMVSCVVFLQIKFVKFGSSKNRNVKFLSKKCYVLSTISLYVPLPKPC